MHADHDTAIRAALAAVRDDMRAGVIGPDEFDMELWSCGTTACIGGWTARHLKIAGQYDLADDLNASAGAGFGDLWKLFFPEPLRRPIHEAPAAIDRYLAGDEPWPAKETAT